MPRLNRPFLYCVVWPLLVWVGAVAVTIGTAEAAPYSCYRYVRSTYVATTCGAGTGQHRPVGWVRGPFLAYSIAGPWSSAGVTSKAYVPPGYTLVWSELQRRG